MQANRLADLGPKSLGQPLRAQFLMQPAQVQVRPGQVGLELEGGPVMFLGLGGAPLVLECPTQTVVRGGPLRLRGLLGASTMMSPRSRSIRGYSSRNLEESIETSKVARISSLSEKRDFSLDLENAADQMQLPALHQLLQ